MNTFIYELKKIRHKFYTEDPASNPMCPDWVKTHMHNNPWTDSRPMLNPYGDMPNLNPMWDIPELNPYGNDWDISPWD